VSYRRTFDNAQCACPECHRGTGALLAKSSFDPAQDDRSELIEEWSHLLNAVRTYFETLVTKIYQYFVKKYFSFRLFSKTKFL